MIKRRSIWMCAMALVLTLAGGAAQAGWWGDTVRGSGKTASEIRSVAGFETVNANGSMDVQIKQTGRELVTVSGDDNIVPLIETRVIDKSQGRTLDIRFKPGASIHSVSKVLVVIEVIKLQGVALSGSGDVLIDGVKGDLLEASLSGSGDIRMVAVECKEIKLRLSGSGDATLAGRAGQLGIKISGSGDVRAKSMDAESVSVSIAGSGDAQVAASKALTVSIAGSGDVAYVGNPSVSSSIAGSGSVKKI